MDDKNILLLSKYLNNKCTGHELTEVARLLTNPSNQRQMSGLLEEASKKFHGHFETSPEHREASWSKIRAELSAHKNSTDNRLRPQRKWLKIAASVTVLIGAGILGLLLILNTPGTRDVAGDVAVQIKTVSNELGEKSRLTLPDGTVVLLNSGTSLTYPEKFDAGVRSVSLSGEAYFDVKKNIDHPFVVNVKGLRTKVLGTTFNIRAYDYYDHVKVSLTSGKIAMQLPGDSNELILDPGQEVIYEVETNVYKVSQFDSEEVLDWQKGILRFDGVSEKLAINILEYWYDVDIETVNSTSNEWKNLSAKYDNEPLENVLISLGFTLDFDYEINDKDIKIIYK
ncbi:MAG: FecR domain-containing protein [Cytophagales bacterium]|nr:FecR domain-containing protein [Cytophagales bacterium]